MVTDLRHFRAENLIVDLSSEAQQTLQLLVNLEEQKAAAELQRKFYQYLLITLNQIKIWQNCLFLPLPRR